MGRAGDEVIAATAAATLLGRIGEPDDMTAAVAFPASDCASYITGEALGVSGGMGIGLS